MPEVHYGNIFVRTSGKMRRGDKVPGHTHNFDHVTFFRSGSFLVKAQLPDGRVIEREFGAVNHMNGDFVHIGRDIDHEFSALEDGSEYVCIYSQRNHLGEVVPTYEGWEPAYGFDPETFERFNGPPIHPEMIAAGVEGIHTAAEEGEAPAVAAVRIFTAMMRARLDVKRAA